MSRRNERQPDWVWRLVAAAALIVPVVAWPGSFDLFRLPKEAAMRAVALLLCVVWTWRIAGGVFPRLPRPHALTVAAIAAWSLFTAAVSTHKLHSLFALFWIFQGIVFFASAYVAAARRGVGSALAVVASGAAVNAAVAISEALFRWYPFSVEVNGRRSIGLMGNPNDLGALLFGPLMFGAAVAIAVPRLRWRAAVLGAALLVAIAASVTVTSVIAVVAGLAAMTLVHSFRRGMVAAVVIFIAAAAGMWLFPPLRGRVVHVARLVESGRLDEATSNRITPALTAWRMIVDRPLTGLGPGTYAYHYVPYKTEAQRLYPRYLGLEGVPLGFTRYAIEVNYGEAHNEFVEVVAEAGFPALLLLAGALGLLGAGTFRAGVARDASDADGERRAVAHLLSLPLAVAIAAACLAQFPLQIAGSYVVLAVIAGICVAWSWRDA